MKLFVDMSYYVVCGVWWLFRLMGIQAKPRTVEISSMTTLDGFRKRY